MLESVGQLQSVYERDGMLIGVDIGGTNLRGALVDRRGVVLERVRMPSEIGLGRDDFLRRLHGCIDSLKVSAGQRGERASAVGLGVPGLIDLCGTVHSSVNMQPLEGVCLATEIERMSGLPAVCANDANMSALGEYAAGAGKGMSSFAVITIGTGLGSGLILNGDLWCGASGYASEMGHMTLEPEGRPCLCGNRGCLEQYVSAQGIMRTMEVLWRERGRAGTAVNPEQLADMARTGDSDATDVFRMTGEFLGTALASVTALLDLEGVVVNGGIAASLDLMAPSLLTAVQARVFPLIGEKFLVRRGALGDDAALVGAALLAARLCTETVSAE